MADLNRLQRKLAIGITRPYRTIPLNTSLVLANIFPLDLMANKSAGTMGKIYGRVERKERRHSPEMAGKMADGEEIMATPNPTEHRRMESVEIRGT